MTTSNNIEVKTTLEQIKIYWSKFKTKFICVESYIISKNIIYETKLQRVNYTKNVNSFFGNL